MRRHSPEEQRWRLRVALLLFSSAVGGCVGTYHPPNWKEVGHTSGLVPARKLAYLTADERAVLCVWTAKALGGFDKRYRCPSGSRISTYSEADCYRTSVKDSDGCQATVRDHERCVVRVASDPCDGSWRSLEECEPIINRCIGLP